MMFAPLMSYKMKRAPYYLAAMLLAGVIGLASFAPSAHAVDLPQAAGSPIAGIAFDDQPLLLPVQRNFQMAMLVASGELGRSCGTMEAYGWRLSKAEQGRVNQIFNNTVDRLRAQGFSVEAQKSKAVSEDVTLFSADRDDKHIILLWSAGEIGLVMVMCETSAPMAPTSETMSPLAVTPLSQSAKTVPSDLSPTLNLNTSRQYAPATMASRSQPMRLPLTREPGYEQFSPLGTWEGSYFCHQGKTGATLQITRLEDDQFEGVFSFFPTAKSPHVAKGKYKVYGDYDAQSYRILINPGDWIERPEGYANTVMIGSFDPVRGNFSAYFQGITGCTSFEATFKPSLKEARVKKKAKTKSLAPKAKKTKKTIVPSAAKKTSVPKKVAKPVKTTPKAEEIISPSELVIEETPISSVKKDEVPTATTSSGTTDKEAVAPEAAITPATKAEEESLPAAAKPYVDDAKKAIQ